MVPKLNKDPIASLRPNPVLIDFGDRTVEIAGVPAVEWLTYLMAEPPDVDALIVNLAPDLEELLFEDRLQLIEIYELLFDIIGSASGRDWWIAMRLLSALKGSWDVLWPYFIKQGYDPNVLSFSAFLDCTLAAILEHMEPKDTTMWLMKLEAPPPALPGREVQEVAELEMSRDAFSAMMRD